MGQALAERSRTEVARPLRVLVPLIKDELEAGDAAGIEHYRRAGEMLIEAKGQVGHGEWTPWIERNFHLTIKTAQNYMLLARKTDKRTAIRFSTLSEVVRPNAEPGHRFSWQEPVRQVIARVNVEALARERQDKEKEQRLMRQLSHQLIDIGYRVLSAELHPDKASGSVEAMSRLNKVRSILKEAI